MKSIRGSLPFILLNVVVSAVTTLVVLWLWNAAHFGSAALQSPRMSSPTARPAAAATLPPLDQAVIQIENVYGPGDPQNEVVVLKRMGDGQLSLTGWQLKDEDGHEFTFPELVLSKDGAVQVFTNPGVNTVIALHWGKTEAMWRSGEQVSLLDSSGNTRASYRIP